MSNTRRDSLNAKRKRKVGRSRDMAAAKAKRKRRL